MYQIITKISDATSSPLDFLYTSLMRQRANIGLIDFSLHVPPDMVAKPPSGHFNVLYFASAGSFTAKEFESIPAPLPISKLFETLESRHAGITAKILDSSLVTVNLNYVDMPENPEDPNQLVIKEGDEVAIIPPVSSG